MRVQKTNVFYEMNSKFLVNFLVYRNSERQDLNEAISMNRKGRKGHRIADYPFAKGL